MNLYKLLFISLAVTKLYFGEEYYLFKDKIDMRNYQENMGAGELVDLIKIVFYASPNYTNRILPVCFDCELLQVTEIDRNNSIFIYGFLKSNIRYCRKDIVLGPFIRYCTNSNEQKIFCEKLIKINIFESQKTSESPVLFKKERMECIKTSIYRLIHEFRYLNYPVNEVGYKLKNVRKSDWYVPKCFSKTINMKKIWLRLFAEARITSNFNKFIKKSIYILQNYYVTSIYEGGTFDTKPDLILKSILKNDKKKEAMMDTILQILNDMELVHRAMELKRRIQQKSIYVLNSSRDSEIELVVFYSFLIYRGESFIISSQRNKILFFIPGEKMLIPEFYFYNNKVLISKSDFDGKEIAKIKIQFETVEGLLITKTVKPLFFGHSPILEDFFLLCA